MYHYITIFATTVMPLVLVDTKPLLFNFQPTFSLQTLYVFALWIC